MFVGISWEAFRGPLGGSFEAPWGLFGGLVWASWGLSGPSWGPAGGLGGPFGPRTIYMHRTMATSLVHFSLLPIRAWQWSWVCGRTRPHPRPWKSSWVRRFRRGGVRRISLRGLARCRLPGGTVHSFCCAKNNENYAPYRVWFSSTP